MSSNGLPFVSVVVPVYNDPERLLRALEALELQTYPSDRFEVVVVDNDSDQSPAEVVNRFPHAKLVRETTPGSYAARNSGISVASGGVIAFTDADCVPTPQWLEAGVNALQHDPEASLVAGRYQRIPANPEAPTASELFEAVTHPDARHRAEVEGFALTGNLMVDRRVFDTVGLFDADNLSLEDRAWCLRARDAGFKIVYEDRARVTEPGARTTLRRHLLKTRRVAGGKIYLERRQSANAREQVRALPWKKLLPPFSDLWRNSFHPTLQHPSQRAKVFGVTLVTHYVSGFERVRLLLGGARERR